MIKISLNMDITISVSPDYLQRMEINLDGHNAIAAGEFPVDLLANESKPMVSQSILKNSTFAQSAINQCFRNNSRVLDSLMITDIQKE